MKIKIIMKYNNGFFYFRIPHVMCNVAWKLLWHVQFLVNSKKKSQQQLSSLIIKQYARSLFSMKLHFLGPKLSLGCRIISCFIFRVIYYFKFHSTWIIKIFYLLYFRILGAKMSGGWIKGKLCRKPLSHMRHCKIGISRQTIQRLSACAFNTEPNGGGILLQLCVTRNHKNHTRCRHPLFFTHNYLTNRQRLHISSFTFCQVIFVPPFSVSCIYPEQHGKRGWKKQGLIGDVKEV